MYMLLKRLAKYVHACACACVWMCVLAYVCACSLCVHVCDLAVCTY